MFAIFRKRRKRLDADRPARRLLYQSRKAAIRESKQSKDRVNSRDDNHRYGNDRGTGVRVIKMDKGKKYREKSNSQGPNFGNFRETEKG